MRYVGVRAETLYRQHRPRTSVHHELHRVSLRQHRVFLGRVVGRVEGQIWTVKRIRFHLRHHESVEVLSIPLHSHLRKRISVPLEMRVQWRKGEIHISGRVPLRGHLRRHVLLENSQGVEHSISEYKNIGSRLANIISYNACIWFNTVNWVLIKYEEFFTIFLKILQPLRQQKLWG